MPEELSFAPKKHIDQRARVFFRWKYLAFETEICSYYESLSSDRPKNAPGPGKVEGSRRGQGMKYLVILVSRAMVSALSSGSQSKSLVFWRQNQTTGGPTS